MAGLGFLWGPPPRVRNHRRIGESSRTAKTNKGQRKEIIYEKSNIDGHPAGVGLFRAFTRSASDQSSARRMLSQLYDGGRVQCA